MAKGLEMTQTEFIHSDETYCLIMTLLSMLLSPDGSLLLKQHAPLHATLPVGMRNRFHSQ
jgi:hypothetical protein